MKEISDVIRKLDALKRGLLEWRKNLWDVVKRANRYATEDVIWIYHEIEDYVSEIIEDLKEIRRSLVKEEK